MASSADKFNFKSGLPDCCGANPDYYTVKAEIPNARLIEMILPPGVEDVPHDHPAHSLYFVNPAKLQVTPIGPDGKPAGEPQTPEVPAGAAPIFPAGAHQVKNIGDSEVKVIFVEPYPSTTPAPAVEGFASPFECDADCYKLLAEDDSWVTGMMEMEPGQEDHLHNHRDHLIYVLEGDEVTIYPEGNKEDAHAVPIKAGAGIPAPFAAGAIFNKHSLKNTGSTKVKMLFFESKV